MKNKDKILVVDDNKLNCLLIEKILSDEYEVVVKNSGQDTLLYLEDHDDVSCLLLDIVMPEMNGFEVIDSIKEDPLISNLPIITMTASDDRENEVKALDNGAWDFVRKPVDVNILKSRIKNCITRSQLYVLEKLQYIVAFDSLCNIYNQYEFIKKTEKKVLKKKDNENYYLIRLDIDRFSLYNNYFGNIEGDKLLKAISEILIDISKKYNTIYGRFSNDVFTILFDGSIEMMEKYILEIKEKIKGYNKTFDIVLTFGVYQVIDKDIPILQMIDKATLAAKKIKAQYEKTYKLYDENMSNQAIHEQQILNEMNHALLNKEFIIYLQPKVNISTGKIIGAESLVRWLSNGKLVPPGEFIPVFERNGFVAKLDMYVWEETLIYLKKRIDSGMDVFPISVNVSRVHLFNSQFVNNLCELVDKYGVNKDYLELEITESIFMDDVTIVKNAIDDLRSAGFKVLMDDFGSGFSSLNVLKDVTFDVLKIDLKFFTSDVNDIRSRKIIDSVVKLAKTLDIPAIAEGVETAEQIVLLKQIGCDFAQGYYYSRPIDVASFDELYLKNKMKES